MQTTKINHLESLCVIHADFDIWSGQTRLITEDIVIGQGGKLPSGKVAKLRSKHVCDPAAHACDFFRAQARAFPVQAHHRTIFSERDRDRDHQNRANLRRLHAPVSVRRA